VWRWKIKGARGNFHIGPLLLAGRLRARHEVTCFAGAISESNALLPFADCFKCSVFFTTQV
jgi:hypothetical protein